MITDGICAEHRKLLQSPAYYLFAKKHLYSDFRMMYNLYIKPITQQRRKEGEKYAGYNQKGAHSQESVGTGL